MALQYKLMKMTGRRPASCAASKTGRDLEPNLLQNDESLQVQIKAVG